MYPFVHQLFTAGFCPELQQYSSFVNQSDLPKSLVYHDTYSTLVLPTEGGEGGEEECDKSWKLVKISNE